jgi:hypothetical protein
MLRLTLIIAVLALSSVALAADAPLKPYQSAAVGAIADYDTACANAAKAYKAAVAKAKADLTIKLTNSLKAATQAGDLDAANAIKARLDELAKPEPADDAKTAATALPGTRWTWYGEQSKPVTPNGWIAFDPVSSSSATHGTLAGTLHSAWGIGHWSILSKDGPLVIELWLDPKSQRHVLTFATDYKSFAVLRADGGVSTGLRSAN